MSGEEVCKFVNRLARDCGFLQLVAVSHSQSTRQRLGSSSLLQSLTILGKNLVFVHVCLAEFYFKAVQVVCCKLRYNVLVLGVLDGHWSD